MLGLHRLGIKGRTIAGCAFMLLLTACALGSALIWRGHRAAIEELEEHAANQVRTLAYSAEPHVLLNDTDALQRVLRGVQRQCNAGRSRDRSQWADPVLVRAW